MSLPNVPPRRTQVSRARTIARRVTCGGVTLILLFLAACGDSSGPDGGGGDGGGGSATLSGTVQEAGSASALPGATVSIGAREATTDANGHFQLTDVPLGATKVRAELAGYVPAEATVTIKEGANGHDFTLSVQEVFLTGAEAAYVPAGVGPLRGTIIVLGGPVASGFVTGDPIAPPDSPDLENSLQQLGASLRALAKSAHVALLGSGAIGLANTTRSDGSLFAALRATAGASGHAELEDAPILMFGLSAGSREASGLVSRHPDRAIGLLVRVPVEVSSLTTPEALAVPTFVMQAELDEVADNASVRTTFANNRSRGALWSLVVEPGVGHHVATGAGNAAAIEWLFTVLTLRLPGSSGDPLVAQPQESGWLGDQTTLEIAPWADFPGDRASASWLLSSSAATSWQVLGTPGGVS